MNNNDAVDHGGLISISLAELFI